VQSASANKIKDLTHLGIRVTFNREVCHMRVSPSCALSLVAVNEYLILQNLQCSRCWKQCGLLCSVGGSPSLLCDMHFSVIVKTGKARY